MRIFGMGTPELIIILIVILIIFGPKNLPKLGSALGKTVKNLRDGMDSGKKELESDEEEVVEAKPAAKKPAPKKAAQRATEQESSEEKEEA